MADYGGDSHRAGGLGPLQGAPCAHRIAFGSRTGQVVLKLKTTWRDGTTRVMMSPMELRQQPQAQVSRA